MMTLRKSQDRGHFDFGWLDTRHTFSFGSYHDPRYPGFSKLRVINEDRVAPGAGFPTHPHRDMEILTYVLDGALQHRDSMGNGSIIRRGDVQRMSAGTGVTHSEHNPSPDQGVHFLQLWILPEAVGLSPSYEQKTFDDAEKRGRLRLVAARDGAEGAVTLHQDARVYVTLLGPGDRVEHPLPVGRRAWIQVARGAISLNGAALDAGDGAALEEEARLVLASADGGVAEALVFELP